MTAKVTTGLAGKLDGKTLATRLEQLASSNADLTSDEEAMLREASEVCMPAGHMDAKTACQMLGELTASMTPIQSHRAKAFFVEQLAMYATPDQLKRAIRDTQIAAVCIKRTPEQTNG